MKIVEIISIISTIFVCILPLFSGLFWLKYVENGPRCRGPAAWPPGPSPGRGGPAPDRPCRAGYAKAVLVGVPGANLVDDRKCWRLKIKNLDDVAINLLIIGLFMSPLYKSAIKVSVLVVLCWTSLSKINRNQKFIDAIKMHKLHYRDIFYIIQQRRYKIDAQIEIGVEPLAYIAAQPFFSVS